jgi:hypothetical protein
MSDRKLGHLLTGSGLIYLVVFDQYGSIHHSEILL